MSITKTMNEGFLITKKSWFTQAVYSIIFSVIFFLIMIPFAFLLAIGSVLRSGTTDSNSQIVITTFNELIDDIINNPLFWISIYLLFLVMLIFISILIGMLQIIGIKKFNNEITSLEDNLKISFHKNTLFPFIVLAFIETIAIAIIGGIMTLLRDFLNLNNQATVNSLDDFINNFLTVENILFIIISIIVLLIVIPPYLISCLAIVEGKASYNAFFFGWKEFVKSIVYLEEITIISLLPTAIVGLIIVLIGIGMVTITGFQNPPVTTNNLTAIEFLIVLSASFGIILLTFLTMIFFIPFFVNSFGKGFQDQRVKN